MGQVYPEQVRSRPLSCTGWTRRPPTPRWVGIWGSRRRRSATGFYADVGMKPSPSPSRLGGRASRPPSRSLPTASRTRADGRAPSAPHARSRSSSRYLPWLGMLRPSQGLECPPFPGRLSGRTAVGMWQASHHAQRDLRFAGDRQDHACRSLCPRDVGSVHLSVDAVEDAMIRAGLEPGWTTGVAVYEAVGAATQQNLMFGRVVSTTAMLRDRPGETPPDGARSRSGSYCFSRRRARSISAGSAPERAASDTFRNCRGNRSWLEPTPTRHGRQDEPIELSSEEPVEELIRRLEPQLAVARGRPALP
jgi:hypothetical protein